MLGLAIPVILVLAVLAVIAVIAIQRVTKKGEEKGSGADIVAYLVMALAVGVAGFALAELANTAFPGDRFIFDPAENVATALAALVVSGPFAVFFWRRQARRRTTYPMSAGWTLYLSIIDLAFGIAFVVAATYLVNGLITGEGFQSWVSTVVFGAILAFHDFAARRTPPQSDAAELPRVIGSAIGLITLIAGLAGTLAALFSSLLDVLTIDYDPWAAMLIVGTPIWIYQWLPKWDEEPGPPRLVWTVVVAIGSFAIMVGAATALGVLVLQYVLADTAAAAQHFEPAPVMIGISITMLAVWLAHRRVLGPERANPLRAYEYALAGLGLAAAVLGAVGLTVLAFDRSLIVGGGTEDVIGVAAALIVGLTMWLVFSRRFEKGDPGDEAAAWPRRLYTLGLGALFGLISAGSLITSLVILLRRLIADSEIDLDSLVTPLAIFVYTGLAGWLLLAAYFKDREAAKSDVVITPFEVVIICAHPGPIATLFPDAARLRVIHRGDEVGVIDRDLGEQIVAAVGTSSSLVWVDDDGFRIAPKLDLS